MCVNRLDEKTSKASRGSRERVFLGLLHVAAPIAAVTGALGSVALMLRAGHPPPLLRVLFAIWVVSPFIGLVLANRASTRWLVPTRATLDSVTLVLTVASLAIYLDRLLRPPASTAAFVFVVVPLASWLLMATVVPIAAFLSRRLSHRGAAA